MPRTSDDPYSDAVIRIENSIRIALDQQGSMNEREVDILMCLRRELRRLDPETAYLPKATIIHRS